MYGFGSLCLEKGSHSMEEVFHGLWSQEVKDRALVTQMWEH